jgi:hypothetical protein
VAIRFHGIDVTTRKPEPVDGVYCAIADIFYPETGAKPGQLLYIKPGYHGTEPADVRSYAAMHPAFPHESTAEQWFSESQTEAYRVLGSHIVDLVCAGGQVRGAEAGAQPDQQPSLPRFFKMAEAYLEAYAQKK